ncbi:MFS transporter [Kribbella jejuensis]|uniref:MFS transporter n=1 Tax=Kribbella jejuensis TaxID=236068 RepID=A0A542EQX8_9ACTN|nr:MFS transporter [Kribbella jejuensis]TQJ17767.1 MFS transporter [Kribbella jejuensis]
MFRAVSAFRSVLALPRVRWLALGSLVARLPKGMLPLTLVLLVSRQTGSYALAGTVTALFSLGDALTAPWQGRLADRFGYARTLLPIAVLHVAAVLGMISTVSPTALCLLAVAAGLGVPPISGAVKARLAELVPDDRMPATFALEALLQQSFFLVGPLLATGLISLTTPAVTVVAAATMVAGGTFGFVVAAGPVRRAPRRRGGHGALRIPAVRMLGMTTLLQSLTYGVLPIALVAAATRAGAPTAAGVVQATLTLGGVIGSMFHRPAAYLRLLTRFACCLVPLAGFAALRSPAGLVGLAMTLAGTGLLATPLATSAYLLIQRTTPAECLTEAFAWQSTGLAIGTAAGAAAGGALVDRGGPVLAFALPPVAVGLAVLVVVVVRRRVPSVFG